MNINALRTLVEVENRGSFAVAADRLGLTLSAVSVQLKNLEQELDVALFDRSVRPPAMTPEARRVSAHARAILAECEAIYAINDTEKALKGHYRIGFIPTAMVRVMPHFLTAAAKHHPAASFSVESGLSTGLAQRIQQGELDVALLTQVPGGDPAIHFQFLLSERFVMAVPRKAQRWSLKRCAEKLTYVKLERPASGIDRRVAERFGALGISCTATQSLDSVEAAMECVNAGLAFAVLPEPDILRYASDAVIRFTGEFSFDRRVGLAARLGSPMRNRLDALAKLLPQ